jgi:hypothetical protein
VLPATQTLPFVVQQMIVVFTDNSIHRVGARWEIAAARFQLVSEVYIR